MFDPLYGRGPVAALVSDDGWLRAMIEAEAALARATLGDGAVAAALAAVTPEQLDRNRLAADTAAHATPVVGLVAQLRAIAGDDVHLGATSQDIVDSAMMLVASRARAEIANAAGRAATAAAALAAQHRDTPVAGRTLLQQALPTSFGLVCADWARGIDAGLAQLAAVELAVQMGGPVGHRDPAVGARVAADLGLADPGAPWHTDRTRVGALAGALGVLCGALAKVGRDVALLSSTEVGEVREAAPGGSSAMAHKRNPVASVAVVACASRAPGLVSTLLAGMAHEHQRAAGLWQAEWGTLSDLLALTGSAAEWAAALLEGLEADAGRMADNLATLAAAGVEEAADPMAYLGHAPRLVDAILQARR